MAWFDDPSKELNRLNQRLLEEEEPEEEYSDEYDEEYWEEEFEEEDLVSDFRNFSNRHSKDLGSFADGYRGEALLEEEEEDWEGNDDEPYAVFYETRRERRRRLRKEKKEKREKRKGRNKTLRLSVIVLLETLVLLGILIWWVMNQWPW